MLETEFLAWVGQTPLSGFMVQTPIAFSVCETLHFIGLCLLIGALLIVDLRMLGLMRVITLRMALKFIPIAIIGFVINAVTGVMFFTSNPPGYWTNWMFWVKMALILAAGLNAIWFAVFEERKVLAVPQGSDVDRATKISAGLSLGLWLLVLLSGRLLPLTQTLGNG